MWGALKMILLLGFAARLRMELTRRHIALVSPNDRRYKSLKPGLMLSLGDHGCDNNTEKKKRSLTAAVFSSSNLLIIHSVAHSTHWC